MKTIPFFVTDWSEINSTEHKGETGTAFWKTLQFEGLRIRIVEYSPGLPGRPLVQQRAHRSMSRR